MTEGQEDAPIKPGARKAVQENVAVPNETKNNALYRTEYWATTAKKLDASNRPIAEASLVNAAASAAKKGASARELLTTITAGNSKR